MLTLHVAPRVEPLADALAVWLRDRAARDGGLGLLGPPTFVVVPGNAVQRTLSLELSRRLGVVSNVRFVKLDWLLGSLVPRAARPKARLLDQEMLQAILVGLLSPERVVAVPELAPARTYLEAAGPAAPDATPDVAREAGDAVDRRRLDLAGRLASLFERYGLERPELVRAWEEGRAAPLPAEAPHARCEPWQRHLWREVFGPDGRLASIAAAGGPEWVPTWRLLDRWPVEQLEAPPHAHFVGLTHVAPAHRTLLATLATRIDIHLHVIEPGVAAHPLVAAWDASAAPTRAAWEAGELSQTEVTPAAASSLLGRLQTSLLGGQAGAGGADDSLRVLSCGSPRREVEAAADEIWRRIQSSAGTSRPLRFDDVAVVLPARDAAVYGAHVEAVFSEAHDLPWTPRGLGRLGRGRLLDAADRLVELPFGACGRDDLLRLLVHPGLHGPDADAERGAWLDWIDRHEVLRGLDRVDLEGTYVERDLHTWDQGLRRLALGAFVPGVRGAELDPLRIGAHDYLPLGVSPDDVGPAGALVARVRSLLADVRCARGGPRPLAAWSRFLHALLQAHLCPADDDERTLLGRITYAARSLEELDPAAGAPVPYRVAAGLLAERLGDLAPFDLAPAEQGIAVGPLEQLRGSPFRLVVLLGFGEAAFPRADTRDVLDLRQAAPAPSDVSARERDLRALLELVASTRDAIVATYTGRDPQTGRELLPSVALVELAAALERTGLLGEGALRALTQDHRLRRYHPDHTLGERTALPEAYEEAHAAALGFHLRAGLRTNLPAGADLPSGEALLDRLHPDARDAVRDLLGLVTVPPRRPPPPVVRLPLRAVRDFLLCPLQAWAKHRLRLPEDAADDDPLEREDEVFTLEEPARSVLLQTAFWEGVAHAPDVAGLRAAIEVAYRRHALRAELQGEAPTGLFADRQRLTDLAVLDAWRENLTSVVDTPLGARPTRFGAAIDLGGGADVTLPMLTLDVDLPLGPVRVELHGATRPVFSDRTGVVRLSTKDATDTYLLEAFVDHALLAAAGALPPGGAFCIFVVPGKPAKKGWGGIDIEPPFDQAGARVWLTSILRDLLGSSHEYLLPAEAGMAYVAAARLAAEAGEPSPSYVEVLDSLLRNPNKRLRSDYGPVRDARRYGPPEDGEELARRRLGEFDARCCAPPAEEAE
jgi:exodeoxyribonuclease V gamma subunit